MKKSIIGLVIVAIVIPISVYAVSPYFTESSINEELPENIATQTMMKDEAMVMEKISTERYEGKFIGVGDGIHDAQGIAKVLPLEDGSSILRLEEFRSTNGPDLYVYLSTDKDASDFVNLGELKANQGNQNYNIPDGVDLEKYDKVLVWCKAFSVLFGSAELNS